MHIFACRLWSREATTNAGSTSRNPRNATAAVWLDRQIVKRPLPRVDPDCPAPPGAETSRPGSIVPVLGSMSVVGTTNFENERMDVCSSSDFSYDSDHEELVGWLQGFLRHPSPERCRQRLGAPWLPRPQQTRDRVPFHEAGSLAHAIARRWRHKVVDCIPDRLGH